MNKINKGILVIALTLILVFSVVYANVMGMGDTVDPREGITPGPMKDYISDRWKDGVPTEPPEGEPIYGSTITLVARQANGEEINILETTSGDYYYNQEYYNKKYGLGPHWREDRAPIEPDNIRYNPHPSAQERGYPIIFIEDKLD